jgi:hypothetical protein
MNKLLSAALGLAVAALPVLAMAPTAFAAGDDTSCDEAKRTVTRLEVRLAGVISEENVAERNALEAAKSALSTAQKALDDALPGVDLGPLKATRDAARGAVDAARAALITDSKRLAGLRVELAAAIEARGKACAEPTTPPTTTQPTVTTTVTPPADVDCGEVSDTEAQRILDVDKSDPNRLDDDRDGIACEDDVTLNDVVVPSGGVNTGGGPA